MALIKCPECGREVSDRADSCIQCGFPFRQKQGKLMIKAQKYPEFGPSPTRKIGIYSKNGTLIGVLYSGSGISVDIDQEVDIYAELMDMWSVKPSNLIRVSPNRTTRIAISYQMTMFSTKVVLSEVDVIDSE